MSRADADRRAVHGAGRPRRRARAERRRGRVAGIVEQALRPRVRAGLRRRAGAGHVHGWRSAVAPAPPRLRSRSRRPARCTTGRWPTRCPSMRTSATARSTSPRRCARRPRISTMRRASVYATPQVNRERRLQRRPDEHRRNDRCLRRLVGRRRLSEVRADDRLHSRPAARRRARLPRADGRLRPGASFSAEARFGVEWLLRMFDDRTGTLYYQVGIGAGNSKTLGDHDIWRLPQADDTLRRQRRERALHPPPAGLSSRTAGQPDQPEPRRARRRRVRALLPGLPQLTARASPRAVCRRPSTSSRSPTRARREIS